MGRALNKLLDQLLDTRFFKDDDAFMATVICTIFLGGIAVAIVLV